MVAEFQCMKTIEAIRLKQQITEEDLTAQMGKKKETIIEPNGRSGLQ